MFGYVNFILFYINTISLTPPLPFQVHGNNRCLYTSVRHSLNIRMPGYLHKDLVYFPNRYLRHQVVMYLVQQRAYFLATHKLYLLGQYTGTGGDPGPFSYKSYLMHLLDHDSWGDHIVLHAISKLWEVWVMILHSSNLRETRIHHNKALGNAEVVMVFNDQAHYNGAGKDMSELAPACQFHSVMC